MISNFTGKCELECRLQFGSGELGTIVGCLAQLDQMRPIRYCSCYVGGDGEGGGE
jgi:hypothetical protein